MSQKAPEPQENELRPPSPAEARYLEVMGKLGRGGNSVAGAAIARSLGLSAPTVHEMLRRLEADGFIVRAQTGGWNLTDDGRRQADAVRRRRRVVEHFLRTVLHVPEDEVAADEAVEGEEGEPGAPGEEAPEDSGGAEPEAES